MGSKAASYALAGPFGGMFKGFGTSTVETNVPAMSPEEQRYMDFFRRMSEGAAGQLGNLGGLAQGDLSKLGPTSADQELIAQSIGRTREITQRELESAMGELQAQLGEQMAAKGMQGASIEAVQRGLLMRNMQQELSKSMLTAQQQGGEALMNLPFRRAEVALNANQALFNQITGMTQMPYQGLLQTRLAQQRSTQKMSPAAQLQALIGAAGTAAKIGAGAGGA